MKLLVTFLDGLLPFLYVFTTYLYGRHFFTLDRRATRWMTPFLWATAGVHFLDLLLRGLYFRYFPASTLFEAMSVLGLAIVLTYIYIEHRIRVKSTGLFILSTVTLIQIFTSLFIRFQHEIPEMFHTPLFVVHTAAAMLGYSALFVSALYGLMYLLLFYELKSARFGVIYRRLPSLDELSEMNTRAAMIGFLFLTVAIFVGIKWWKHIAPEAGHFDPIVIAAYAVWFIYGLMVYGKKIGGWTGKLLAYLSLWGFVMILISVIVVNLFIATFHRFG
ncbi:MAG: hypothetical protein D6681_05265 [Calditrichaeota bacterium]|nr:MAG: hypothetical protein D6681_05265 [Calditrichota bacterium]